MQCFRTDDSSQRKGKKTSGFLHAGHEGFHFHLVLHISSPAQPPTIRTLKLAGAEMLPEWGRGKTFAPLQAKRSSLPSFFARGSLQMTRKGYKVPTECYRALSFLCNDIHLQMVKAPNMEALPVPVCFHSFRHCFG